MTENSLHILRIVFCAICCSVLTTPGLSQPIVFRINAGGESYTDTLGNHWSADQVYSPGGWGYVGGQTYQTDDGISGTSDDPLYHTERFWLDAYKFDVPNGDYDVTLKFAEIWYKRPNNRMFHVKIEDRTVLSYFDIYATVGHDHAIDYTFTCHVNDGRLSIKFEHYEPYAHAKISAIEIVTSGTPEPQLFVIPRSVNFDSTAASRTVEITNSGSGTLNWQANEATEENWIISISPDSGSLNALESQIVTVTVDRNGLAAGDYDGTIIVTSNGGEQDVVISLRVGSNDPVLSIEPDSLDYGGLLSKKRIEIRNIGSGSLDWTVVEKIDETWLTFDSPTSGNLLSGESQTLMVVVDRTSVNKDIYDNIITVTTNGGHRDVKVKMKVGKDTLRINCGGSCYTDTRGAIWQADMGFEGGDFYRVNQDVANTVEPALYQTERWGMETYQFDLQNDKQYEVSLHFAEIYWTSPGQRLFDVTIEDSLVLNDYDIFAEIGANVADQKKYLVELTDGQLNLAFDASQDEPKLSAIEITQVTQESILRIQPEMLDFGDTLSTLIFIITNTGTDTLNWSAIANPDDDWITAIQPDSNSLLPEESDTVTVVIDRINLPNNTYTGSILISSDVELFELPISMRVSHYVPYIQRVNAGGDYYTSVNGDFYAADQPYQARSWGYVAGQIYRENRDIKNTEDDFLYISERWGLDSYIFDVPNGNYVVKLHFAEIYFRHRNQRIMEVAIEAEVAISDWDIYAEIRQRTAVIKTFKVVVNDNQLNIDFSASVYEPKISAIEVIRIPVTNDLAKQFNWEEGLTESQNVVAFDLAQNYPNPFNIETSISYYLPVRSYVTLNIFNALGQNQTTLVAAAQSSGSYNIVWNAKDRNDEPVATGVYFFKIIARPTDPELPPFIMTRRLLLTK